MCELSKLFSVALNLYDKIDNFEGSRASEEFGKLVCNACSTCQDAISITEHLDLFSTNENLDDLSSNEIKFMIFPALLGYFLAQKNENRKESLENALSSYHAFEELCTNYGISAENNSSSSQKLATKPSAESVREAKIRRYKAKKALKEKLQSLALTLDNSNVDEEVIRDYNLTLVQHWLLIMSDEVPTLRQELDILSLKPEQLAEAEQHQPAPKAPMKPFILTRDAAQAAVFGAGYPSLPTMSLDQFFAEQVKRGIFPSPRPCAPNTELGVRRIDPSEANRAAEEEKKAKDDALAEADDAEYLSKARNFDEFKDHNRRGCGNRMNRA